MPWTLGSREKSFWTLSSGLFTDIPGRNAIGLINPSSSAFTQFMPLPNRSFGSFSVNLLKSYSFFTSLPWEWHLSHLLISLWPYSFEHASKTFLSCHCIIPLWQEPQ